MMIFVICHTGAISVDYYSSCLSSKIICFVTLYIPIEEYVLYRFETDLSIFCVYSLVLLTHSIIE